MALIRPGPSLTIISQSASLRSVLDRALTVAGSTGSVLLVGETGVGKELFADYIHEASPRAEGPLVKVALSSVPQELLESELFGHERGAFTHAISEKKGLLELAQSGSVFLDDIDDVPGAIQVKLLRALEAREVQRVGAAKPIPIDVRVIAASKLDLKALVDAGRFRADLYYRLNVFPLEIPPLRQRREDIPILVEHFLKRFSPDQEIVFSQAAQDALDEYGWPGNVRELRNVVQRVALFASGEVGVDDLPAELTNGHVTDRLIKACLNCATEESMTFQEVVACLETNLLRQALGDCSNNHTRAARTLGLSPSTFRDKLKKYDLG